MFYRKCKENNAQLADLTHIVICCLSANPFDELIEWLLSKLIPGLDFVDEYGDESVSESVGGDEENSEEESEESTKRAKRASTKVTKGKQKVEVESEESDSDSEMAHTQELPEEKAKRKTKKEKKSSSAANALEELLVSDILRGLIAENKETMLATLVNDYVWTVVGRSEKNFSIFAKTLCNIHPALVSRMIPKITTCVTDQDLQTRMFAVDAAASVFISEKSSPTAATEWPHLFRALLGRSKDHETEIRIALLLFAQNYLAIQNTPNNAKKLIFDSVRERIGDFALKVRIHAIDTVHTICMSDPSGIDSIDLECLKEISKRTIDKVDTVRLAAAHALAQIYESALSQLLVAFEETESAMISISSFSGPERTASMGTLSRPKLKPSASELGMVTSEEELKQRLDLRKTRFETFFSSVPSTIIERYLAKDLNMDERALIDDFINKIFFSKACQTISSYVSSLAEIKAAAESASTAKDTPSKTTKRGAQLKEKAKEAEKLSKENLANADASTSAIAQARHIALVTSSLTTSALSRLLKWLEEKKNIRDEVRASLSVENIADARKLFIEGLEKRFGRIGKVPMTEQMRDLFLAMLDPSTLEKRLMSIIKSILSNTKQTSRIPTLRIVGKLYFECFSTGVARAWIAQLTRYTSQGSVSRYDASTLLDDEGNEMDAVKKEIFTSVYKTICGGQMPQMERRVQITLELLQRSVAIHPRYIVESLGALDNLLKSSGNHKAVAQAAARMISLTASVVTTSGTQDESREDHINSLIQLVSNAKDSKTSAEAGAALMSYFANSNDPDAARIEADEFIDELTRTVLYSENAGEESEENEESDEENFSNKKRGKNRRNSPKKAASKNRSNSTIDRVAPAFAALTSVAKLITTEKAFPIVNQAIKFASRVLASENGTKLSKETMSSPSEHSHPLTRAAVEGLHFGVTWLRTLPSQSASSSSGGAKQNANSSAKKSGSRTPQTRTPATSPFRTPKQTKSTAKGSASISPGAGKSKAGGAVSPARVPFLLQKDQETVASKFAAMLRNVIDGEQMDLDKVWLRAAAITGALRLFEYRPYDELFDLQFYLRMSEVLMDEDMPELLANEIKVTLNQLLSVVHRLPLKYLPFAVILGTGDKIALSPLFEVRRQFAKTQTSAIIAAKNARGSDDLISRIVSSTLPEYALPWLVFILAHSSTLSDDAPKYKKTWEILSLFLASVLQSSNFDFLYQLLDDIRQLEDAVDPDSYSIHIVAELGLNVIGELRASDPKLQRPDLTNSAMDPKKVLLPSVLFKPRYGVDKDGTKFIRVDSNLRSHLPSDWKSPFKKTSSILSTLIQYGHEPRKTPGKRQKRTSAKKTRAKRPEEQEEELDLSDHFSSESSDEEMQFSSDDEDGSVRKRGKKSAAKNTARVAKKGGKSSKNSDEQDPVHSLGASTPSSSKLSKESVSPAKRTTPARRAKQIADERSLSARMDTDSSDEEISSEEEVAPSKTREKRLSTSPKQVSSVNSRKRVDESDSGESEEEKTFSPPKRAKQSGTPASKKQTSPGSSSKFTPKRATSMNVDEDEESLPISSRRTKRSHPTPTPLSSAKKNSTTPPNKNKTTKNSTSALESESEEDEVEVQKSRPNKRAKLASSPPASSKGANRRALKAQHGDESGEEEDGANGAEGKIASSRARRAAAKPSTATTPVANKSKPSTAPTARTSARRK